MLQKNGAKLLQAFAQQNEQKHIYHFGQGVHQFVGYGHSNAIAIEGRTSVILVDTLDSPDRSALMLTDLQRA